MHPHTVAVKREVRNADQKMCFISNADTVNGVAFHDICFYEILDNFSKSASNTVFP